MSWLQTFAGSVLWAELLDGALQVAGPGDERTIPLRRRADGRLEAASRQHLVAGLRELAPRAPWQARGKLWCALPARGVSLRRFSIPRTQPESLRRVLTLQVEARFPLPPDALAWGSVPAIGTTPGSNDGLEEICVAAVRSDTIAELSEVFTEAGFDPQFTLASLIRQPGFPAQPARAVALHFGELGSEWTAWDGAFPTLTRSVPCGEASVLGTLAKAWNTTSTEAATRLRNGASVADPTLLQAFTPFHQSLQALPEPVGSNAQEFWSLTGSEPLIAVVSQLLPQLRPGATLVTPVTSPAPSGSAAIRGLRQRTAGHNGSEPFGPGLVRLQLPDAKRPLSLSGLPPIPWPSGRLGGQGIQALDHHG